MEDKLVTYKHLKVGQEIKGTRGGRWDESFSAVVKSINPAYVTVEMWGKAGNEEKIDASFMFRVEMTEEEFNLKYREKAREVLKGIQNKLRKDEIGYHEMWNAWIYGTPYEIAQYCAKENIKVVGHSTEIYPKIAMFSGDTLDAGVCAEYQDGERFWCHYRSEDIAEMIERHKDLID